MIEIVALPSRVTVLGRLGEHEHRCIKFPLSDYTQMYPDATYTLLNLRPGDAAAYPVANTAVQGGYLLWTVTSTDLTKDGHGKCELLIMDGDVVAKSEFYPTSVLPALDGSGTAPGPWESWQTVFARLKEDAENAASAAAQSATSAATSAEQAADASRAVQDMGVEHETLTPGSDPTLEKIVGPDGAVTLNFGLAPGPQGIQGATGPAGEDGFSPTITVTDITGGHRVTITDATGAHSFDVMDSGGAVESVNGQTGDVVLDAQDVGAYEKPASGIPASDLAAGVIPTVPVQDVRVNGASVLGAQGVAEIPKANDNGTFGVVGIYAGYATGIGVNSDGYLSIRPTTNANVKAGNGNYIPVTSSVQHAASFYGLAKAAGDSTQSASSNAVGTYTEDAKSAISEMLSGAVSVSGSTPSITAKPGIRYICGECATLDITTPATGIVDVVFESGSTATVLTVTPPTGMTMKWAGGFDPTALEANTTYEINIMDGVYGVVGVWT